MTDREENTGIGNWEQKIGEKLIGKTIAAVRYQTRDEADNWGFTARAIVIIFDDTSFIVPSRDDEGNDAGALFTSYEDLPTIPVIY
jgi:hypothetical protein